MTPPTLPRSPGPVVQPSVVATPPPVVGAQPASQPLAPPARTGNANPALPPTQPGRAQGAQAIEQPRLASGVPMTVEVYPAEGGRPALSVTISVPESLSSTDRARLQGFLRDAIRSYPRGIVAQLMQARTPPVTFNAVANDPARPNQVGAYVFNTGVLTLNLAQLLAGGGDGRQALHDIRHELAHAVSDLMDPAPFMSIPGNVQTGSGQPSPLLAHYQAIFNQAVRAHDACSCWREQQVTPALRQARVAADEQAAANAGAITSYAAFGNAASQQHLNLAVEEMMAESIAAWVDPAQREVLRERDPLLAATLDVAMREADAGHLDRARQILLFASDLGANASMSIRAMMMGSRALPDDRTALQWFGTALQVARTAFSHVASTGPLRATLAARARDTLNQLARVEELLVAAQARNQDPARAGPLQATLQSMRATRAIMTTSFPELATAAQQPSLIHEPPAR